MLCIVQSGLLATVSSASVFTELHREQRCSCCCDAAEELHTSGQHYN
jgi:hypothetical protein